jgi:hypothetical protein
LCKLCSGTTTQLSCLRICMTKRTHMQECDWRVWRDIRT